jgi:hypothetical protein
MLWTDTCRELFCPNSRRFAEFVVVMVKKEDRKEFIG